MAQPLAVIHPNSKAAQIQRRILRSSVNNLAGNLEVSCALTDSFSYGLPQHKPPARA